MYWGTLYFAQWACGASVEAVQILVDYDACMWHGLKAGPNPTTYVPSCGCPIRPLQQTAEWPGTSAYASRTITLPRVTWWTALVYTFADILAITNRYWYWTTAASSFALIIDWLYHLRRLHSFSVGSFGWSSHLCMVTTCLSRFTMCHSTPSSVVPDISHTPSGELPDIHLVDDHCFRLPFRNIYLAVRR